MLRASQVCDAVLETNLKSEIFKLTTKMRKRLCTKVVAMRV